MDFVILAVAGAFAGLMAGLLGIGGGAIIVPAMVFVFEHQGISADYAMRAALGTSLATIVFTAAASIRTHHAHGAVEWRTAAALAPGVLLGALAGAAAADRLPGRVLKMLFGAFLVLVALQMMRGAALAGRRRLPPWPGQAVAGAVIGAASSLFGIGGGSLVVPYLTWCSVAVRRAVATSAAVGFPIAVAGATGYAVVGLDEVGLPGPNLGYIVLPALAGIVAGSVLFAPLGARLAHRLPERTVRRVFAVFLILLGARMLLA